MRRLDFRGSRAFGGMPRTIADARQPRALRNHPGFRCDPPPVDGAAAARAIELGMRALSRGLKEDPTKSVV